MLPSHAGLCAGRNTAPTGLGCQVAITSSVAGRGDGILDLAEALSLAKFSALLAAAAVAIVAIAVTLARLVLNGSTRRRWQRAGRACGGDLVIPPPVIERAASDATPSLSGQEW